MIAPRIGESFGQFYFSLGLMIGVAILNLAGD
jgi:hypothetical protein